MRRWPQRILPGQPHDQVADLVADRGRPGRFVWAPFLVKQAAMPAQQPARADYPPLA